MVSRQRERERALPGRRLAEDGDDERPGRRCRVGEVESATKPEEHVRDEDEQKNQQATLLDTGGGIELPFALRLRPVVFTNELVERFKRGTGREYTTAATRYKRT